MRDWTRKKKKNEKGSARNVEERESKRRDEQRSLDFLTNVLGEIEGTDSRLTIALRLRLCSKGESKELVSKQKKEELERGKRERTFEEDHFGDGFDDLEQRRLLPLDDCEREGKSQLELLSLNRLRDLPGFLAGGKTPPDPDAPACCQL